MGIAPVKAKRGATSPIQPLARYVESRSHRLLVLIWECMKTSLVCLIPFGTCFDVLGDDCWVDAGGSNH